MKRLVLTTLAALLSLGAFATVASAGQTHLGDSAADLNGDGEVTLSELKRYNRAQRHS